MPNRDTLGSREPNRKKEERRKKKEERRKKKEESPMPAITTKDGARVYYKDWAQVSPWFSVTAGHSARTLGRTQCSFLPAAASAASPTTVVAMAAPANPGTATK